MEYIGLPLSRDSLLEQFYFRRIMQKIVNVLALLSFGVSAAVVAGGTYVYLNKDAIVDNVKDGVTKAATEAITEALPGMLDSAVPAVPTETGLPIPQL
jgi:hypothetical protein